MAQEKSFAEETQISEQAVGRSGGWTEGSDGSHASSLRRFVGRERPLEVFHFLSVVKETLKMIVKS